jgi:single-strand DNA-binding protein
MSSPVPSGINLSVIAGTLSSPPELRTLPSGALVLALQVSVRAGEGPAESVPIAWFDPPGAASAWSSGQELVVVGRVRRRFFRTGGATASRTEVVAEAVVPARRKAAVAKALAAATAAIEAAAEP